MFKSTGRNFKNLKENRKKPRSGEAILWEALKGRKFMGLKFRRQHPINNYIVDFFCNELMFAIDVDGKYHLDEEQIELDIDRTKNLNTLGITVFRLTEEEATNPDIALNAVKLFIESNIKTPSPMGEGYDEGL